MAINKVTLVGKTTTVPEIRNREGVEKKATVKLETIEEWNSPKGEKRQVLEQHNLVFWGRTAERVIRYVRKDDLLFVEGRISTRKIEDEEGRESYITEIIVRDMRLLGGGEEEKRNAKEEEDDLPF